MSSFRKRSEVKNPEAQMAYEASQLNSSQVATLALHSHREKEV
jgi:hypothetical protein